MHTIQYWQPFINKHVAFTKIPHSRSLGIDLKPEWKEWFIYNENVDEGDWRKKKQINWKNIPFDCPSIPPLSKMWRADCFPASEWTGNKLDCTYIGWGSKLIEKKRHRQGCGKEKVTSIIKNFNVDQGVQEIWRCYCCHCCLSSLSIREASQEVKNNDFIIWITSSYFLNTFFDQQTLKIISAVESFLWPNKQETPEEGRGIQRPKRCVSTNTNKDENNSPKNYTKKDRRWSIRYWNWKIFIVFYFDVFEIKIKWFTGHWLNS